MRFGFLIFVQKYEIMMKQKKRLWKINAKMLLKVSLQRWLYVRFCSCIL